MALAQGWPVWSTAAAAIAGLVLLGMERPGRAGIGPVATLVALAYWLGAVSSGIHWIALVCGLVIAALARDRDEILHSECALKLLWVMGGAIALSWAGLELLTLATGTDVVIEQWAVLQLGLEPEFLWNTALPLSLLVGMVMLGGAPFHFWIADVFQGVRPWLAPLAVASLQVAGAGWLSARLHAIAGFPPGARLAGALLHIATLVACLAGAATLVTQRRPERRVGTLASLNGALVLAMLASGRPLDPGWIQAWTAHLVLALTGASTLARFLPASTPAIGWGAPIVRRHPGATIAGLVSIASLSGLPGTPGAALWLEVARALARGNRATLLLVLGATWLAALSVALRQVREVFGVPAPEGTVVRAVPWRARAALWIAGGGLAILAWASFLARSKLPFAVAWWGK